MDIIILIGAIFFLFFLIMGAKLIPFLALIITSILLGLFQGMPVLDIIASIEKGLGGTLGHLAIIIGFGAILGKLISESGAAQQIAMTLIKKFGKQNAEWAILVTSLVLGITLFWEVGFVILIPIVFTVAVAADLSLVKVGIPMLAALGVTHAFLPPHPGPTAVAGILGANVGLVMLYGLILAVPVAIIAGPLFSKLFKNINPEVPQHMISTKIMAEDELPSFGISVFTGLTPVIIILAGLIGRQMLKEGTLAYNIFAFIGNADIALLVSALIAVYVFGIRKKVPMKALMKTAQSGLAGVGGIMFIIGAGGAFKQVILDSGMTDAIGNLLQLWDLSPYILAFIITALIRLAVGSATVTIMTSAAIVLPLLSTQGVSPELLTLLLGTASGFGGVPNDPSFWMIKEFFNLDMKQTVKIWCGMSTLIPFLGLTGVLIMSIFVH